MLTKTIDVKKKLPAHHKDPFDRMLIAQAELKKLFWSAKTRSSQNMLSKWSGKRPFKTNFHVIQNQRALLSKNVFVVF